MGNFYAMPRYIMRRDCVDRILKKSACTDKKLLEIGYGAADIFKVYLKYRMKIYGFDFSKAAYETAKRSYSNNNITLYSEKKDILPNTYDFVVACEVLEHIEDDKQAVKEWASYLKAGGKLLISVPAHMSKWGANDLISGHYRRYERQELIDLCTQNSLKVDYLYCYDFPMGLILNPLRDKRVEKKLKEKSGSTKEELTKTSGLDRESNKFIRVLANEHLWSLIARLQRFFYGFDWGSCYLIECTKTGG